MRAPLVVFGIGLMTAVGLIARKVFGAPAPGKAGSGLFVDARPTQADVTQHQHAEPVGSPRPGVETFKNTILAKYGGKNDGIWGDAAHNQHESEHNVGTAWDWGQPDSATAHRVIDWLLASEDAWARKLGVGYIIFERRMYRVYAPEKGWTAYTGADPHTGHVHFSFSRAGAMGKTSGYTTDLIWPLP